MDDCGFGFIYSDSWKSDVHIDNGKLILTWALKANPEDALVSPDSKPDEFQHVFEYIE
jgi:hypothetical protein